MSKRSQKKKCNFCGNRFIGEEESSTSKIQPELTDAPTWIIDPIDGTANFVRKMPITCISVGLVVNKEQVIGIVYNPFLNELYSAIKGHGAYLNSKRIFCSGVEGIIQKKKSKNFDYPKKIFCRHYKIGFKLWVVTGTSWQSQRPLHVSSETSHVYNSRVSWETFTILFIYFLWIIRIRSYGCAALGLCYVARGATDAYQCDGLYPWDVAAGSLIVREAGGFVCSSNGRWTIFFFKLCFLLVNFFIGEEFDLMNPNFIAAATKKLAEEYVAVEKRADEERRLKECAKSL